MSEKYFTRNFLYKKIFSFSLLQEKGNRKEKEKEKRFNLLENKFFIIHSA